MGRWKLHVAMLSLHTEFCCSNTRLLQPRAIFSGFAGAPGIPLTAPDSGVLGLCGNPRPQLSKPKFSTLLICKESPQVLTPDYQESKKTSRIYFFIFLSSLPVCQSQKCKANFTVNSATKLSPSWTFFWAVQLICKHFSCFWTNASKPELSSF